MTRKEFAQKLLLQSMVMRGTDFNKTEPPTEADGRAMVNRSRYITELVAEVPDVFFDINTPVPEPVSVSGLDVGNLKHWRSGST